MRNPDRINEILNVLSELWHHYPDQRLGQLLENFCFFNKDMMFYQEDDISLITLNSFLKREEN